MNWHLLSLIIPVCSFYKSVMTPYNEYKKYEKGQPHRLSNAVMKIVKRVLQKENIHRQIVLKVLNSSEDLVYSKVVATPEERKYYIVLHPNICEASLPWVITREIFHILNESEIGLGAFRIYSSLITSLMTSIDIFKYSQHSCATAWALTAASVAIAQAFHAHKTESRADDFALNHCSDEELIRGIEYLIMMERIRLHNNPENNRFVDFFHPPEGPRIQKILQYLDLKKHRGKDTLGEIKILERRV